MNLRGFYKSSRARERARVRARAQDNVVKLEIYREGFATGRFVVMNE